MTILTPRAAVMKALTKVEVDIAALYAAALAFKAEPGVGRCPLDMSSNMKHGDLAKILKGLNRWNYSCPACGMEFED